jgi:hypothetical protein
MAARREGEGAAHLVFRSRSVRIAGWVDLGVGLVVVLVGVGLGLSGGVRGSAPLGVAIGILGAVLVLSGLARATARIEISRAQLSWTWSFSRQTLALEDLDDAALVEKGSPASGGAWAGFLAGGLLWVAIWWLWDVLWAFVTSEPSLGPVELVVIKHVGGPVPVKPIGAWSTRASHSDADQALEYLRAAIVSSTRPPTATPDILRTDAWDQGGTGG